MTELQCFFCFFFKSIYIYFTFLHGLVYVQVSTWTELVLEELADELSFLGEFLL